MRCSRNTGRNRPCAGGAAEPARRRRLRRSEMKKEIDMRQPGEITQVKGNMLQVTFCRPEACAACNACEGGKKEHSIWVRGEGEVGEIAVVEMPDQMVAKASFMAYGMPLVLLLAGLILGHALTGGSDAGTALGAAAGLACGMILLKVTEKNRRGKDQWNPEVVEVLKKSAGEGDLNADAV